MPDIEKRDHFGMHARAGMYAYSGAPADLELQTAITVLVNFPYEPDTAAWVNKVKSAPTEVIAGAIAMWVPPSPHRQQGESWIATDANDFLAPRREAATAILHARFAAEAGRQTDHMLRLTNVLAWLTGVMLLAVVAQIVLALHPPK